MLCRQGSVPGAKKLSGVWLLPGDFRYPGVKYNTGISRFKPGELYSRNTTVQISPVPEMQHGEERSCTVNEYIRPYRLPQCCLFD